MKTENQIWQEQKIIEFAEEIKIAKFMGLTVYDGLSDDGKKKWKGEVRQFSPYQLLYKTDWNWIMPVIERIESLGYVVDIGKNQCHINKTGMFSDWFSCDIIDETKILSTYKAVVQFIKFYNQNQK